MDVRPEYPAASIVDSRRLMGPNLYSVRGGAVLEVTFDDARAESLTSAWSARAAELVHALGWGEAEIHVRREAGGATLFLAAPVDVLMTATEASEQAWVLAESPIDTASRDAIVARLLAAADAERRTRPAMAAVFDGALSRGLSATFDDEWLTIGSGAGSLSWALGDVPACREVPWNTVRDIPIALVTGSNGKTTTTRLVAAMWRASGVVPGWSCSDGVWAGDHQLDWGDFSGPAGARRLLREPAIGAAVLETARGGILRRGLAVSRADAAIITNVSADHFGEYGITTERDLVEVKGVVARVLGGAGRLVLNADDALLAGHAARMGAMNLCWFSASPEHPTLDAHVRTGGDAATVLEGRVMLHRDGVSYDLGGVAAMPITLRGAALHNVENILGAALLGCALRIPLDAIRVALASFGASARDNPGRLQIFRFGAITVLVDYAHNPDGLAALCDTVKATPSRRRLLLLGQAGNRDDEQIRALARAAFSVLPFDRVIVKEEMALLRGRSPGEVPGILVDELARLGMPSERVDVAPSELAAMKRAFEWAQDGDLLVCPIHVDKTDVLAWLGRLAESGWRAGAPLPE